jgi:hypothetical protein
MNAPQGQELTIRGVASAEQSIAGRKVVLPATVELPSSVVAGVRAERPASMMEQALAAALPQGREYRLSIAARRSEHWRGTLDAISRLPLVNGELTRGASWDALQHHAAFPTAAMVVHVASPQGVSAAGVPFDLLSRVVGQELSNRAMGTERTVVVIGQQLAEVARPQISLGDREEVSRRSFALLRLVEKLKSHGFNIEARLDTDLMAEQGYRQSCKGLKSAEQKTYPLAHREACLVEALRQTEGPVVYSGWSSFNSVAEFNEVRQGSPGAQRNFVRYCSMPVHHHLREQFPAEYPVVATVPGMAVAAEGQIVPTHPDLVVPITRFGQPLLQVEPLRIMLNRHDELNLRQALRDPFDLDTAGQRAQIGLQRHLWHTIMGLQKIAPQLLDHPQRLLADLNVDERLVQDWRQEAMHAAQKSAAQTQAHLWQAMLAAANTRKEVLNHYLRALLEELGLELSSQRYDAAVMVPMNSAERMLSLQDDTFSEASAPHRATRTLDTRFVSAQAA